MEEEAIEQAIGHRLVMACRPNCRARIELEDRICSLLPREGVPCAHVREVRNEPHLSDICHTLPHEMRILVHHDVGALTLIKILWAHIQYKSYFQSDEVPGDDPSRFSTIFYF